MGRGVPAAWGALEELGQVPMSRPAQFEVHSGGKTLRYVQRLGTDSTHYADGPRRLRIPAKVNTVPIDRDDTLPVGANHHAAYREILSERGSEVAAGYAMGGGCPPVVPVQPANPPTLTPMSWSPWC